MYRLGTGMFITSILLFIGWIVYRLWQEGVAMDEIVSLLIVSLFIGGIVLVFTSGKV